MDNPLPLVLPIFPLSGAVLLPRAQLPLNIFEPRYLAMTRDALATHKCIGMIQPNTESTPAAVFSIGCVGKISSHKTTDDGRIVLTLTGIMRFRVEREFIADTAYRQVHASYAGFEQDLTEPTTLHPERRSTLMENLSAYLEAKGLGADWTAVEAAGDETVVSALAMLCPFSAAEKQALLEAHDLPARVETLITLLSFGAKAIGLQDGDAPEVRH
jgi:uncharacterized protein